MTTPLRLSRFSAATRAWLVAGLVVAAVAAQLAVTPLTPTAAATTIVTLSGEADFPDGFTVPAGEEWEFDPAADTTVTVSGNVIVNGTLRMRPHSKSVEHTLVFTGIDESKFTGGGMMPLPGDVGLWVVGDGVLDISGTEKTAWSYDWQSEWAGDEVVAAPIERGDYETFTPVTGAADVPAPNEYGFEAELLNLTRNVRIEGTPSGKTHVFVHSTRPQTIRYAAIRYVAPDFAGTDVTGRYGLHLHHGKDGSRGTVIEGVVVRDADGHAFVPHASHGVTLKDTIAYMTTSEAYWWDPATVDNPGNETDDVVFDRIVAAATSGNPYGKHTAAAVALEAGENLVIRNSVVVGMLGAGQNASGYHWPATAKGIWTFEDNIAHNNKSHGAFVWQNTPELHEIDGFTAYYNSKAGVDHGAYNNGYQWRDLTLLGNELAAVESHALGKETSDGSFDTQQWIGLATDGGVLRPMSHNPNESSRPVRFVDCDLGTVVFDEGANPGMYDFVACGLEPGDFVLTPTDTWQNTGANPATVIRVQRADGTAFLLTGKGVVTTIDAFYGDGTATSPSEPEPVPEPAPRERRTRPHPRPRR